MQIGRAFAAEQAADLIDGDEAGVYALVAFAFKRGLDFARQA